MKSVIYFTLTMFITLTFYSCSEDDIMRYHTNEQEVQDAWLLTEVNYSQLSTLPYNRSTINLFYDEEDRIKEFGAMGVSTNPIIRYLDNRIQITKSRSSGSVSTYDTIHIALNADGNIKYAVHTTYSKQTIGSLVNVTLTNLDSTVFVYDTNKYMSQMIHYKRNNINQYYTSYAENFALVAGNVAEMTNNQGERYIYTYHEEDHTHESEFCYEVPRNVNSGYGKCWTLQILPLISDYLGKKNKNNVASVQIEYPQGTSTANKYTQITYDYIYNENELVDKANMSGMIGGSQPFNNAFITFSHIEK